MRAPKNERHSEEGAHKKEAVILRLRESVRDGER